MIETTQPVEKVKFGFGQIGKETPELAKWAFRIFFYLTSTVAVVLAMSTQIPEGIKLIILEYTTIANTVAHGLSKMFGINIDSEEYYKQ